MTLAAENQDARRDEGVSRLRRVFALRAMGAEGMSQRQIAEALGVSQAPLPHIDAWLVRVGEIIQRGKAAHLEDDLLQEAGDLLMMKLGEAGG